MRLKQNTVTNTSNPRMHCWYFAALLRTGRFWKDIIIAKKVYCGNLDYDFVNGYFFFRFIALSFACSIFSDKATLSLNM